MRKAIRNRQRSMAVIFDPRIWEFYTQLDRHVKRDFNFEVCNRLRWTKSTFYRRFSEGYNWNPDELRIVLMIYNNYKRIYGNE